MKHASYRAAPCVGHAAAQAVARPRASCPPLPAAAVASPAMKRAAYRDATFACRAAAHAVAGPRAWRAPLPAAMRQGTPS